MITFYAIAAGISIVLAVIVTGLVVVLCLVIGQVADAIRGDRGDRDEEWGPGPGPGGPRPPARAPRHLSRPSRPMARGRR